MVLKNYKGTIASAKKLVHLSGWAREKVNCWLGKGEGQLLAEPRHRGLLHVPEERPHLGDLQDSNKRHGHRSGVCVQGKGHVQ